jgi:hypothetical protein
MRLDLYHYADTETLRRLDRIESALETIIERLQKMSLDFFRLETEVSENTTVIQSAVTLLTGIAQAIRDAAADQTKILSLADTLDQQTAALAGAIAANTGAPAEPTPTV